MVHADCFARGVLHRTLLLAYRHPPSPLHLSAACWLLQFPTRQAVAAADAVFQVFSSVSEVCFQVFYLDIAYVAMAIYTCCKYMFQVF
jgi:hypothetical protein